MSLVTSYVVLLKGVFGLHGARLPLNAQLFHLFQNKGFFNSNCFFSSCVGSVKPISDP